MEKTKTEDYTNRYISKVRTNYTNPYDDPEFCKLEDVVGDILIYKMLAKKMSRDDWKSLNNYRNQILETVCKNCEHPHAVVGEKKIVTKTLNTVECEKQRKLVYGKPIITVKRIYASCKGCKVYQLLKVIDRVTAGRRERVKQKKRSK